MDSYKSLFCRQCYVYDCNIHGILQPRNLRIQTERAIQKEMNDEREVLVEHDEYTRNHEQNRKVKFEQPFVPICLPCNNHHHPAEINNNSTNLSPLHKVICEHAFQIFRGDVRKIAIMFGTTIDEISKYIHETNISLHSYVQSHLHHNENADEPKKKKTKTSDNKAMKCYNYTWL